MVLFEYIGKGDHEVFEPTIAEQMTEVENRRIDAKNRRRQLVAHLAEEIGVPAEDVPSALNDFHRFINDQVYAGVSRKPSH